MFGIHNGILALTYVIGANGFAYYDLLVRDNPSLESVIAYGATWPLHVFSLT